MKRRRLWVWILGPLGAVAAIGGGIVWDAHRRADAVIERHRRNVEGRIAEFLARPTVRLPLQMPGIEGNAWDHYQKILPVLGSLPSDEAEEIPELVGFLSEERAPDDEALGVIYLKYGPELEILRAALNSREWVPPGTSRWAGFPDINLHLPFIEVGKFISGGIAHYRRMGNPKRILDLAELGLAMANDAGRRTYLSGELVRGVVENVMASSMSRVLEAHEFNGSQLEAFAGRLDRLEIGRPALREALESEELIWLGVLSGILPISGSEAGMVGRPTWRDLWSSKIVSARVLNEVPPAVALGRRLLDLSPSERVKEIKRLRKSPRESSIAAGYWGTSVLKVLLGDVQQLLQRHQLRIAVAIAWYEAEKGRLPGTLEDLVPRYLGAAPVCPYSGKPFLYQSGKLWSVGADGVDDGGTLPSDGEPDVEKAGTDVVWTVKRR